MRLIMMGTGPFAVPTFRALYETRHAPAALATAPLRTHRGKPVAPISSIRDVAAEHGTPILDPEDINAPIRKPGLPRLRPICWWFATMGRSSPPATLATARHGGINLHASLLPKYRGAAPINWAIFHGETETGNTVIHMSPQIDAGPCIAQARTAIGPDETAAELEIRLAEAGARLIGEAIDLLEAGKAVRAAARSGLGVQGPAAQKNRRLDRLVAFGRGPQKPRPRPGTLAENLYVLASVRRAARPIDPRPAGGGRRQPRRRLTRRSLGGRRTTIDDRRRKGRGSAKQRSTVREKTDGDRRVSPRLPRPAGRSFWIRGSEFSIAEFLIFHGYPLNQIPCKEGKGKNGKMGIECIFFHLSTDFTEIIFISIFSLSLFPALH